MPWVMEEAKRFNPPADYPRPGADDRRAELEEDRRRIGKAYTARALSDDEFSEAVARIDSELALLDNAAEAVGVPQVIDWDRWDREAINTVLRTYWSAVTLDKTMQPIAAEWRVPAEWLR
jgi:hypothetical protein